MREQSARTWSHRRPRADQLARLLFSLTLSLPAQAAPETPQRIVTLIPSAAELVSDCLGENLGAIVGVSAATDEPPALRLRPSVGPYPKVSLERVAALRPDLVVASRAGNAEHQVTRLRAARIRVEVLQEQTFRDLPTNLRRVGGWLGDDARRRCGAIAERVEREWRALAASASASLASTAPPTMVALVSLEPLIVVGAGSYLSEVFEQLGYRNAYRDLSQSYPRVSIEDALARRPEIWLRLDRMGDAATVALAPESPRLADAWARSGARVVSFSDSALLRLTPRLLPAARALGERLAGMGQPSRELPASVGGWSHEQWLEWRLPRILAALAVGAALALAGALLQVGFGNPLLEPYTLGVSSGAALGAVLALSVLGSLGGGAPVGALAGAALAGALLVWLARARQLGAQDLLLSGVMLQFFCSSGVALWMSLASAEGLQGAIYWLMGDLSRVSLGAAVTAFGLVFALTIWIVSRSDRWDALLGGDDDARLLGVEPERVRLEIVLVSSVLVAIAVSQAGQIGFVGLIVPHLARRAGGVLHRRMLLAAACIGGVTLAGSDFVARTLVAPIELPVGVVTALIGAPAFVWLLGRRAR